MSFKHSDDNQLKQVALMVYDYHQTSAAIADTSAPPSLDESLLSLLVYLEYYLSRGWRLC